MTAGKALERLDRGLHEEAHEAELHAVLLLELLAVLLAQAHHLRHVDLVEGREDRGGVLGLEQALGDALAQRRHLHALFAAGAGGGVERGARAFAAAPSALLEHVFLHHPALTPLPWMLFGSMPLSAAIARATGVTFAPLLDDAASRGGRQEPPSAAAGCGATARWPSTSRWCR